MKEYVPPEEEEKENVNPFPIRIWHTVDEYREFLASLIGPPSAINWDEE